VLQAGSNDSGRGIRLSKISFRLSGIYGIALLALMYFLEDRIGRDSPPAITHPEFYYGFLGVTLAWQIAFLIVASDPLRYRPIMIAAMVEKFGYVVALALLAINHRVEGLPLAVFGGMDLIWGVLFLICYLRLSRHPGARSPENR
jgi:hypothetical protein